MKFRELPSRYSQKLITSLCEVVFTSSDLNQKWTGLTNFKSRFLVSTFMKILPELLVKVSSINLHENPLWTTRQCFQYQFSWKYFMNYSSRFLVSLSWKPFMNYSSSRFLVSTFMKILSELLAVKVSSINFHENPFWTTRCQGSYYQFSWKSFLNYSFCDRQKDDAFFCTLKMEESQPKSRT